MKLPYNIQIRYFQPRDIGIAIPPISIQSNQTEPSSIDKTFSNTSNLNNDENLLSEASLNPNDIDIDDIDILKNDHADGAMTHGHSHHDGHGPDGLSDISFKFATFSLLGLFFITTIAIGFRKLQRNKLKRNAKAAKLDEDDYLDSKHSHNHVRFGNGIEINDCSDFESAMFQSPSANISALNSQDPKNSNININNINNNNVNSNTPLLQNLYDVKINNMDSMGNTTIIEIKSPNNKPKKQEGVIINQIIQNSNLYRPNNPHHDPNLIASTFEPSLLPSDIIPAKSQSVSTNSDHQLYSEDSQSHQFIDHYNSTDPLNVGSMKNINNINCFSTGGHKKSQKKIGSVDEESYDNVDNNNNNEQIQNGIKNCSTCEDMINSR
jgi:cbb3-type cytochrome oxidase subunit 3